MNQPQVTADEVATWVDRHLGERAVGMQRVGWHLSDVWVVRLSRRHIVVKVRPSADRISACAVVQARAADWLTWVPKVLVTPAPFGTGLIASAEQYLIGGEVLTTGPRLAEIYANALATLLRHLPLPTEVPDTGPAPAWVRWNQAGMPTGSIWPERDDGPADLNGAPIPAWLAEAATWVQERLRHDRSRTLLAHCDFEAQNMRFQDGAPIALYDWDSAAEVSEAVAVGAASAVFTADGRSGTEPSVTQSAEFLEAYWLRTRGRRPLAAELHHCYAAGLWVRLYNAAKASADGENEAVERLYSQLDERLQLAGA